MERNRGCSLLFQRKLVIDGSFAALCSLHDLKDVGDERRKGCLDIDILLGAALHEAPALLAGELRAHIIGDHLVRHIDLVADQHYHDVLVAVILDLLVPRLERQETVPIADIVDKDVRAEEEAMLGALAKPTQAPY